MINNQSYQGIERSMFPDWFGWFIIDLLNDNPQATEEHRAEIIVQLDFEVRLFNYEQNKNI